eukprot:scaffold1404_cov37-Cyclotella_meneghiniana.AAC.2
MPRTPLVWHKCQVTQGKCRDNKDPGACCGGLFELPNSDTFRWIEQNGEQKRDHLELGCDQSAERRQAIVPGV